MKIKTKFSNNEILQGILERNDFIIKYTRELTFPMIKKYIVANSGKYEDAEDIFQDAYIIIYKQLKNDKLELTSGFENYFFGVSKNLWLKALSRKKLSNMVNPNNYKELAGNLEEENNENEKDILVQIHFIKLQNFCQKILKLYIEKQSFKDIAQILNISEANARKRKQRCQEALSENIKQDPKYEELFIN